MNGTNFAGNASRQIGDLSKLTTQDKSSVVNAINEVAQGGGGGGGDSYTKAQIDAKFAVIDDAIGGVEDALDALLG